MARYEEIWSESKNINGEGYLVYKIRIEIKIKDEEEVIAMMLIAKNK